MAEFRQLAEVRDEFGVIRVVESGDYRFLEFGDEVEQSCCYVPEPHWLEYDYTRAMLLGTLLGSAPQRVLFLGLGAGSLTLACLKAFPHLQAEAVELRPAVLQLARQYMGLVDDPRLQVHCGDATVLLAQCQSADVVFVDLYTDTGPAAAHLAVGFLRECRAKVRPGGWLVINQWSASDGKPLGAALLRGCLGHDYLECPLPEGNVVLLVPAEDEQLAELDLLAQRAAACGALLGFDLLACVRRLQPCS